MAGRNTKTNFDFFRLDTTFFSNKKIKALRRHFGSVGILTYLYILSYSYGNNGYYIRIDSVEEFAYDIAESIGNSNLTQIASVATDCINYLASRGEINKHLLDKGVISGESIQRQYIEMCLAAKRKVEIKEEYRLVDTSEYPIEKNGICSEEKAISSEENIINSEELPQSKVKESKTSNEVIKVSKKDKEINSDNGDKTRAYARESYKELMSAHEIPERVQLELWRFIQHCHANGQVITNDRLRSLWFKLKKLYPPSDVNGMVQALRTAIDKGYYDIKDGKDWIAESIEAMRAAGIKLPGNVDEEEDEEE